MNAFPMVALCALRQPLIHTRPCPNCGLHEVNLGYARCATCQIQGDAACALMESRAHQP